MYLPHIHASLFTSPSASFCRSLFCPKFRALMFFLTAHKSLSGLRLYAVWSTPYICACVRLCMFAHTCACVHLNACAYVCMRVAPFFSTKKRQKRQFFKLQARAPCLPIGLSTPSSPLIAHVEKHHFCGTHEFFPIFHANSMPYTACCKALLFISVLPTVSMCSIDFGGLRKITNKNIKK